MRNNLMDTVAQAVNSLVSALQLPDESAKANDTLGSMNFQFSRIYPIRIMILETGLFINTKTTALCVLEVCAAGGKQRYCRHTGAFVADKNPSWRAVHY